MAPGLAVAPIPAIILGYNVQISRFLFITIYVNQIEEKKNDFVESETGRRIRPYIEDAALQIKTHIKDAAVESRPHTLEGLL